MHLLKNERNHSSCLKIKSLTPTPFLALLCHLSCISFLKQPEQKAKKSSNYLGKKHTHQKKKKKKGKFCNSSKSLPIIQLGQRCSRDTGVDERELVPAHSGTARPRRGRGAPGSRRDTRSGASPAQQSRAGAGAALGAGSVPPGPAAGAAVPCVPHRVSGWLSQGPGKAWIQNQRQNHGKDWMKARARVLLTARRRGKRCRAQHSASQRTAVNLQQPWKKSKLKLNLLKMG